MGGDYPSTKPIPKKEPEFETIQEAVDYQKFLEKEAKLIKRLKKKKKKLKTI